MPKNTQAVSKLLNTTLLAPKRAIKSPKYFTLPNSSLAITATRVLATALRFEPKMAAASSISVLPIEDVLDKVCTSATNVRWQTNPSQKPRNLTAPFIPGHFSVPDNEDHAFFSITGIGDAHGFVSFCVFTEINYL